MVPPTKVCSRKMTRAPDVADTRTCSRINSTVNFALFVKVRLDGRSRYCQSSSNGIQRYTSTVSIGHSLASQAARQAVQVELWQLERPGPAMPTYNGRSGISFGGGNRVGCRPGTAFRI